MPTTLDDTISALSHPIRREIIQVLQLGGGFSASVEGLCAAMGSTIPPNTLHHHIDYLIHHGIIVPSRVGRSKNLTLQTVPIQQLIDALTYTLTLGDPNAHNRTDPPNPTPPDPIRTVGGGEDRPLHDLGEGDPPL